MKNKKALLAKVLSYSILAFQAIFTLSTLPNFLSASDYKGIFILLALFAVTIVVIFFFPNLLSVMNNVPYRWSVLIVLLISAIMIVLTVSRLPLILDGISNRLADYVVVIGGGIFALVNLVAMLIPIGGSKSGSPPKDENL
jgi:hypothetical protein